MVEINNEN